MRTDILIVGSGCAGLYCALNLPEDKEIMIITKDTVEHSDSYLAQGGICMLRDEEDFDSYFEDTMRAGSYMNKPEAVETMIKESPELIDDLIKLGVDFTRDEKGNLKFTKEGAHHNERILYHEDATGKEIMVHLYEACKKRKNITIKEHWTMVDILSADNRCFGIIVNKNGDGLDTLYADYTVLACGGIGGIYKYSTNFKHITGDGVAVAIRHGVKVKNVNYVQTHPTTFYIEKNPDRSFLISESVRGEGALLYNNKGERFTNELKPRDIVTENIIAEMEKEGADNVWLSFEPIDPKELKTHFPNIVEYCKSQGYDVPRQMIPIIPAQHYFMGGIKADLNSKTSMEQLYAVGETACNGVHGHNRLASNSLLESMVFAKRAAIDMMEHYDEVRTKQFNNIDWTEYEDLDKWQEENKKIILQEIEDENEKETNMFDPITLKMNVDPLIKSALKEDVTSEDVTTNSVMPNAVAGKVEIYCKEDGVICGLQVFQRAFELLDENVNVHLHVKDGDKVEAGQRLGSVRGDIRVLLVGERTALNFLQRMSGIATYTRTIADMLEGSKTKLLDTRKTTPNNRIFEKYAVRVGGGHNHRYNLSDGVLLKDNHISAAGGVKEAIKAAKDYAPFVRKIEVEVESLDMVKDAVEAGADIIMLDNMDHEHIKEAIGVIDGRAEIEVSGNVTKDNIEKLLDLGVDYVSSGALTHSAPSLDISLKNLHRV